METETDEEEDFADPLFAALAETPAGEVLPRRTLVDGQYRIERVLGEGGMGVVYLARDLRLDRDVAIKVGSARSAASVGRLAREALALARVSHPNVVTIHQVGELAGRAYVAMEYVTGGTARTWCAGRPWREIVALYVEAGVGLAAAHEAGLVHRDFKPDNVLVGSDGRPRVADFGLAREQAEVLAGMDERSTGALGTPAYMPPEQAAGGELDARADQFAFCASLWEALFGALPEAVLARPAASKVPRHVEAALRRGLARDRDDRWPAMAPLLAELRRDPARQRRIMIIGGALACVALAAFVLVARAGRAADPCDGGDAQLAGAWAPDAVRVNLAPAGAAPWVAQTADRTVAGLDGYAQRWSAGYRAVCEAGHGAWSRDLADRGLACLAERKNALVATARTLATGQRLATRADGLVERLLEPAECADAAYVGARVAPPSDPVRAGAIDAVTAQLDALEVAVEAGQFRAAKAKLPALVAASDALAYPPLVARIANARGQLALYLDDTAGALDALHDAYFTARQARDSPLAATTASLRAVALLDASRDAEAVEWARLAEAELATASDHDTEGSVLLSLAVVTRSHDPKRAMAYADRLVELGRVRPCCLSRTLMTRGEVRDGVGDFHGALADLDEALQVATAKYAAAHPMLEEIELKRALVLDHLRRPGDAVAAARHALAISEQLSGPDSPSAINALSTLANTLKSDGKLDEALAAFARSMEATARSDGPRSYNYASDLNNHGDLLRQLKRYDEAVAELAQSTEIFAEVVGADGNEVGLVELNLWNTLFEADRVLDGAPHIAVALPIYAKTPDSPIYGQALIAQGITEAARGDYAHAKPHVEQGLAKLDDDAPWRARGRAMLADIALETGDVASARSLAELARTDAQVGGQVDALAGIEKLIARLPKK